MSNSFNIHINNTEDSKKPSNVQSLPVKFREQGFLCKIGEVNKEDEPFVLLKIEINDATIYTELHDFIIAQPQDLVDRCTEITSRIKTDTNIKICPKCSKLFNPKIDGERLFFSYSILNDFILGSTSLPCVTYPESRICLNLTSGFFPKFQLFIHRLDKNPIWSYNELDNHPSLIQTLGYNRVEEDNQVRNEDEIRQLYTQIMEKERDEKQLQVVRSTLDWVLDKQESVPGMNGEK